MTGAAWAQATPPEVPPPAAPPAAAEAPPPPPPAAPPPAAAVPPVVEATPPPAPTPPTATEAMPATRPEALPPIDVGACIRASSLFQSATDPSTVNDWGMNNAYVELHAGGKVHKNVGVTLNVNADAANYGTSGNMSAALEDAIISFDFLDEFHVWAGHLLVMVDRANSSGPFFMLPWNYPGNFAGPGFAAAPLEGPFGRNNGVNVWGDIMGGKLSYFAGVYDNGSGNTAGAVTSSPLLSARVRLALWDPEPGFWGNCSYFGDKDILSFDVGAQYEAHGSAARDPATGAIITDKNWGEVNAGALLEKKLGGGSFATAEAAYYHYNVLDGGISDTFYVLGAYAAPTMGVGSIQPMVRYQWEKVKSGPGSNPWNLDVAVSYLVKGPALRVVATYSHTKMGEFATPVADSANAIELGAQAIFF
jgi:hypothetical protein